MSEIIIDNKPKEKEETKEEETSKTVSSFCSVCKTPLSLPFPPVLTFEGVVCSVISIPHSQGISCPNCTTYHNIVVKPTRLDLYLVPMQKPILNEDNKIIPFTGHLKIVKN